jgi:hypothetical protein
MQMRKKLGLLGSMLGLFAVRAIAQDAATIADVRCVVVGMQIAGAAASPQQSSGVFITLYYMGRLDGRGVKKGVEEQLIAEEASNMTNADYASETKRCEAGLAETGQQITKIGNDLIERGKKTPAH